MSNPQTDKKADDVCNDSKAKVGSDCQTSEVHDQKAKEQVSSIPNVKTKMKNETAVEKKPLPFTKATTPSTEKETFPAKKAV